MIQRIQSVWLFLASMIAGLLFLFPLFHYRAVAYPSMLPQEHWESVKNYLPLLIMAAALVLLPLVAIFFFGNRPRQRGIVWLSILFCIGFIALEAMRFANLGNMAGLSWAIPGPVLPVVSIVLDFFALRGIRKDEKLIKSLDRLR